MAENYVDTLVKSLEAVIVKIVDCIKVEDTARDNLSEDEEDEAEAITNRINDLEYTQEHVQSAIEQLKEME